MSDSVQQLADIPRQFIKEGTSFINRCTKRMFYTDYLDPSPSI